MIPHHDLYGEAEPQLEKPHGTAARRIIVVGEIIVLGDRVVDCPTWLPAIRGARWSVVGKQYGLGKAVVADDVVPTLP